MDGSVGDGGECDTGGWVVMRGARERERGGGGRERERERGGEGTIAGAGMGDLPTWCPPRATPAVPTPAAQGPHRAFLESKQEASTAWPAPA